ncbi:urea ABC transporter ATP-binding protein UrtD [Verrucomicrobia bacterium LW23]|nr:urea ABC transporter ATP-binding protein UrtD [Verrucomicrobia bacterium LW23]
MKHLVQAGEKPTHHDFILAAEGVNKVFDGFKAITNLNFYMDEGELRTVIGPNGAGKTTFMDLITGRTKPTSGKITFAGNIELNPLSADQIYRLGIGRKFQNPTVYIHHTVYDNLLLSLKGSRSVFSTLFGKVTSTDKDRIYSILETIGLTECVHMLAGTLAHGKKQWLEIGMLLAQDARLLLVDEPAAGLSDEETAKTGELLLSLAGKHSLIVIEHDMVFVRQIAKKVTVLHQGSILCEGTVDEVQNNERVREVYLGRKAAH